MDIPTEVIAPQPAIIIEMNNVPAIMKELYYTNGRQNIFTYPPTRTYLWLIATSLLLAVLFYLFSFSNDVAWVVLLVLDILTLVAFLVAFIIQAKSYLAWKKGIDAYLKELSQQGKQSLFLMPHSFEVKNDKENVIVRWSNIKKVTFKKDFVQLENESGALYIFTAKSMQTAEFETLTTFVRQKMNDPVVITEAP